MIVRVYFLICACLWACALSRYRPLSVPGLLRCAAVRVAVGLDFGSFLRSIQQPHLAYTVLARIFHAAQDAFGSLSSDALPVVAPVLQRCRDLLASWLLDGSARMPVSDADVDGDGDTDVVNEPQPGQAPSPVRPQLPASLPLASLLSPRFTHGAAVLLAPAARDPYIAPSPYDVLGMLQEHSEADSAADGADPLLANSAQALVGAAGAAVTVSQVEVLMSVMPPVSECLEVNSLREAVTVVPSLHELFHFYTEGQAASGSRRDGHNVVFGSEAMDMKSFAHKSAAGGPTIPEPDFRRLLHDFGVCPKLVSAHVRSCLPPSVVRSRCFA
jgi:hypothetical protein